METLVTKLLLVLALPVVVTILWQRFTRSSWYLLPFALGAYIFVHVVMIPVGQAIPTLFGFLYSSNSDLGYFPYWIVNLAIKGVFAQGIQLACLLAANEKKFWQSEELSWQEGILFGLGYGSAMMLFHAGKELYGFAWDAGMLNRMGPHTPAIFSLFQPELSETAVRSMNDMLPWWLTINMTAGFGVTTMIFHAGTSLALVLCLKRRSVKLFLVAVIYFTVYRLTPEILNHSPFLQSIFPIVYYISALVPFLLIFRLRKTLPKERQTA